MLVSYMQHLKAIRSREAPRAGGKHPGVVPPSHMMGRASPMLGCIDLYRRTRPSLPECNGRLGRCRERPAESEGCRAAMRAGYGQTRAVLPPHRPV